MLASASRLRAKQRAVRIEGTAKESGSPALELQSSLDLEESRGSVAAQKCTQNAGGYIHVVNNSSEPRIGDVPDGLIEVRVIEDVESLQSDLEPRALPPGDGKVLHYREVGIDEAGSVDLVAALIAETAEQWTHRGCELGWSETWLRESCAAARFWRATYLVPEQERPGTDERAAVVVG